jgi:methionyl-tRNA formyltransferase
MKIAIIGRTEILYDIVERLNATGHSITCILTSKESPEYLRSAEDFRHLAERLGIPYACGGQIIDNYEFLKRAGGDVAVSINYTGIIPKTIIDMYPLGVLNAHGGDLPRYRGNACQAWAILNGESRIGLCIHKMIGGELDSGDIIARDYFPINIKTKITEVWLWIQKRTPDLMINSLELINHNTSYILERQTKSTSAILRCFPRRPEDGKIDWNMSAEYIIRLINATNKPYHGAYCFFEGQKIIIWDAEIIGEDEAICATPGQVIKITESYWDVMCGKGRIRINDSEANGEKVQPITVIRSIRARMS